MEKDKYEMDGSGAESRGFCMAVLVAMIVGALAWFAILSVCF